MFACTFAGHREVYKSSVLEAVRQSIVEILTRDDEIVFYNGGMGEFDTLCARAVNEVKRAHPEKRILHVLALPYMMKRINSQKAYYETMFDQILIVDLPPGTHYKRAIQARNRWMVDHSDCVIAYLHRPFGGAYETVSYAHRCGKEVVNVFCDDSSGNVDNSSLL